jgi:hypothetical protein
MLWTGDNLDAVEIVRSPEWVWFELERVGD